MNELLLTALVSAVLAGGSVWKYKTYQYEAEEAERIAAVAEVTRIARHKVGEASTEHEVAKTKITTEYVVVTKDIEHVVNKIEYRDRICFDDDGLRAHAAAVRLTGNTSEPSYPMPAASAPAGRASSVSP